MDESLMHAEPLGNGKSIYVTKNHTFGTDAVLLADFAKKYKIKSAVDLGTGCGIIGFLILRDLPEAKVFGVDISEEAISAAEKTAEDFGFFNFTPICSNLTELKCKLEFGCHDLVVCNPPYKAKNAGLTNENMKIKTARHETECSLKDIIEVSAKLLKTSGKLCMCHRPERLAELLRLMSENKIEPKRLRIVCKSNGCEPWLVLVTGVRCANMGLRIDPPLFVYKNGKFSEEMLKIYGTYKEGHAL